MTSGSALHQFRTMICAALATVLVIFPVQPASARVRALLIGVSEYEHSAITPLHGPRNDVTLMWRWLRRLGVEPQDITVLADGIRQGPEFPTVTATPTLAHIREQLKHLAEVSIAADVVVFEFSGHGTTQPHFARSGSDSIKAEDQVLLPRDADDFQEDEHGVHNGLLDHDLGQQLDAIRAKGAFVWAIIDACHAGYSTRAVSNATPRVVPPDVLKIPASGSRAASAAEEPPIGQVTGRREPEGIAGFFAVDSRTLAIEQEFAAGYEAPLSGGGDAPTLGLFTYYLHRTLGEGKAQTYRQLAALVLSAIETGEPTAMYRLPVFDGDLDRPILSSLRQPARRWPARIAGQELRVQAGGLQGFTLRSDVDVYLEPGGGAKVATGSVAVSNPLSSAVDLGAATASLGTAVGDSILWAEVSNPAVPTTFRVSRPPQTAAGSPIARVLERATELASIGGISVELANADDAGAGAWLQIDKDELLLFSSAERTARGSPQTPIARHSLESMQTEGAAQILSDEFWRLARAAHFARIGIPGFATGVLQDAKFSISPRLIKASDVVSRARPCAAVPARATLLTPGSAWPTRDGDALCLFVSNEESFDLAVAAFYVDVSGGVALADPSTRSQGCWKLVGAGSGGHGPQPLGPGVRVVISKQGRELPLGHEYLVVVAFELAPGTVRPDICQLQQPSISSARATRGERTALMELLQPTESTRAVTYRSGPGQPDSLVRTYILDVANSD